MEVCKSREMWHLDPSAYPVWKWRVVLIDNTTVLLIFIRYMLQISIINIPIHVSFSNFTLIFQ